MSTYTKKELASVLEKHAKWLRDEDGGEWADLSWANLSRANLSGANLSWACYAWAQVAFAEHGKCGRMLVSFQSAEDSPLMFQCGCFYGSESDLRTYIDAGRPEWKESRLLALECALKLVAYRKGGAQ